MFIYSLRWGFDSFKLLSTGSFVRCVRVDHMFASTGENVKYCSLQSVGRHYERGWSTMKMLNKGFMHTDLSSYKNER